LPDRDDLRAVRRHRRELTLHLDEMLAADGSTEVTQEEQDRRPLAPELREVEDAAGPRENRVGCWLADGDHPSSTTRAAL
jgi:hypothetical protein